ncbi:hypothetical protein FGADI_1 [Fusarium gaditjirri]|uniref:Uncharacterized protein n=1 Tax=Fusarium gaditjirri TaxID=282569 RepID=A0A8H4X4I7_9HYPO|nr:hypothetical protein FGADI_1 [Fusarium gaditjirri]
MSDDGLAFPDLESATIKELYPHPDDTRLLQRLQANWSKYNAYWDTDTKKELLKLINRGDVKTNGTIRENPSGHKLWKKQGDVSWAQWIAMRTHYGANKLTKFQSKLAKKYRHIDTDSWICPSQQQNHIWMVGTHSDDGPLCTKGEENPEKARQDSLAMNEIEEADNLQAQTQTDSDSRKRAHSGAPGGPQQTKRRTEVHCVPSHSPLVVHWPRPQTSTTATLLEGQNGRYRQGNRGSDDKPSNSYTSIYSGTFHPPPMSNGSLPQGIEHGGRVDLQDAREKAAELTRRADRDAKMWKGVDRIERCVNKLTASMPQEMKDLKRSVDELKSTAETHCEEMEEKEKEIRELQRKSQEQERKFHEQQDQLNSQKQMIEEFREIILTVWKKLHQHQEHAPQHSQGAATPGYMTTAPTSNQTSINFQGQYFVTNYIGGQAPMNAGPGEPRHHALP